MIKKVLSSDFGRGALTLFILINIFNFFNFLFHFFMGRLLGPADYGVLAVLMSVVFLYGIPTEAIQNLISRYTSRFSLKRENNKIKFLMFKSLKKSFTFSLILFIFTIFVSLILSSFLSISFWLILFTNLLVFAAFSVPVIRGVLQGRKKFGDLGMTLVFESVIKLTISIFLVMLGLKIFGAITGVLVGSFAALLFGLYFNRDISKEKAKETKFGGIYTESIHYFITMLIILLAFNIDVILAKRFFTAIDAGKYAALSILGRIIYLGTFSISKTMFPFASEGYDKKKDTKKLFKKSLLVVGSLCFIGILFYVAVPKIIIFVLYGNQYTSVSNLLVYSAIALSFLSLSNLTLLYCLSTNRLKNSYYLFIFLGLEVILLSIFNNSLQEYIMAFMISSIILFITSLIFLKFGGLSKK